MRHKGMMLRSKGIAIQSASLIQSSYQGNSSRTLLYKDGSPSQHS